MGLSIQLLGPPRMERGGIGLEPLRGHKAWGLLAFLLRSQVRPSRERVASLLFPEADDPLGTLRWTLSVLRRQMGDQAELGGDPLQLTLRPGSLVDVDVLARGTWIEAVALPGLGHELLDGLVFRASPGFEIWLENERRHVMGMTSAVLHQAALAFLARGEAIAAAHHAAELLRLNPYDENAHVLMVRCLRAVGDPDAALRQVEAATELFKRELDVEPGPALRAAAVAFEEGVAALHEGTTLAEETGSRGVAAVGWREIGWVQFLRAHYERAEKSLDRASELGAGDDRELAWVDVIRGACRHDVGDYPTAGELLRSALVRARTLGTGQPLGQALTLLGRYHLLRGEIEDARGLLDQALDEVEARGMVAFGPWPESFRGEIDVIRGDVAAAEARFEHAFALGCQVGDPCWEGISLRGLGLVAAARGDLARAFELLVEAPRLCRRLPDTYLWIEAYALDALCAVAVEHGAEFTVRWIDELEAIAARRGIRELVLRAAVYRARIGESGAAFVARSLAAEIDNPALDSLLETADLRPGSTRRPA